MNLTRIDVDKVNKHKNGRGYSLEKQVSNHRQAIEDLTDCSNHITVSIPDDFQRAEFLTDSIHCQDVTLQASIGLIRSDVNNMRNNFEKAASVLIEMDPYRTRRRNTKTPAQNSAIDFNIGWGETGVDLR